MVCRYETMTISRRVAIASDNGVSRLNAATPASERTNMASSVA